MKKKYFIFFLIIGIISGNVNAKENEYPDVTTDIEVRYKWYKEVIAGGEYYPLRKITEQDRYDKENFKYVKSSVIKAEACDYPGEFYKIEPIEYYSYRTLYGAKYVVIENIEPETAVEIYYNNEYLTYQIISHENNVLTLYLYKNRLCDQLLFHIDTNDKYKITLYRDSDLKEPIISAELENKKTSTPNIDWTIHENAYNYTSLTTTKYEETSLTKKIEQKTMCSYSEKYVYKYDVKKEYYDDEYHSYIEGHIKDEENYRFYYKGEPIVINNTIEITKEKIKEIPKIEYIYLEKEDNVAEDKIECKPITQTKIETQIIEKEINKIPKKIYITIILLSVIISILILKEFIKKCKIN